jgi:hypothetical protein
MKTKLNMDTGVLFSLQWSSMEKQNSNLAFLFASVRWGFIAFECGLGAPSLIRLYIVLMCWHILGFW